MQMKSTNQLKNHLLNLFEKWTKSAPKINFTKADSWNRLEWFKGFLAGKAFVTTVKKKIVIYFIGLTNSMSGPTLQVSTLKKCYEGHDECVDCKVFYFFEEVDVNQFVTKEDMLYRFGAELEKQGLKLGQILIHTN